MAGKGGGAWKVAYADFVTAMMAFFMVMWLVAQNKPVKEAVAGYFRDPGKSMGVSILPGKSDSLLPSAHGGAIPKGAPAAPVRTTGRGSGAGTERGSKADPEANGDGTAKPNQRGVYEGNRFAVGTLVQFADESADLDEKGKRVLDELAPDLVGKRFRIEIRGHAADQQLPAGGAFRDAWDLSYARSVVTMRYLTEKGVDSKRVRLSQIATNELIATKDEISPKAQQSLVEVYMLNEIVPDPGDGPQPRGGREKKIPERFKPKLPGAKKHREQPAE